MAGPRTLPSMNAGITGQTLKAIEGLKKFEKPFLSLIGLQDNLLGTPRIQNRFIKISKPSIPFLWWNISNIIT